VRMCLATTTLRMHGHNPYVRCRAIEHSILAIQYNHNFAESMSPQTQPH
jgi:hypothetical protein